MVLTSTPQRHGVTLLEAILAVVILAAGASATLLTLDGDTLDRRRVKTETIAVSRLLAHARNTAMESRGIVRVRYQARNGRTELTITRDQSSLMPEQIWTTLLAEGIRLQGNPREIQFRADGSSNNALRWNIATGRTAGEVTVSAVTGQAQHTVP